MEEKPINFRCTTNTMILKCKWCQIKFETKNKKKSNCSHHCAVMSRRHERFPEIGKNVGVKKECVNCGDMIQDNSKNNIKKYCSKSCQKKSNRHWAWLWGIKKRAQVKGWEFALTKEDLIIPEYCPILNIKIVRAGQYTYNAPTIDRIDNNKGYTKDNILVMSRSANQMKCDMPLDIWEKFKDKLIIKNE